MVVQRARQVFLHFALFILIVGGCDCVHRRQSLSPGFLGRRVDVQSGRQDRVRAPLVDLQVPEVSLEPPAMRGE